MTAVYAPTIVPPPVPGEVMLDFWGVILLECLYDVVNQIAPTPNTAFELEVTESIATQL